MGDGRALQAGTSHNLGQNFAKAFEIQFQGRDKTLQHAWTTSWGVSTRMIGGLIMTHGDDNGLILPPRVAPYQVVIVPIPRGNWEETVLPKAREIEAELTRQGIRVMLDKRDAYTPGWKFAEWELRGVPVRIEIGPKDIEKSQVVVARRDTRAKSSLPMENLAAAVTDLLDEIQKALLQRALTFREEHTTRVGDLRRVQERDGGPSGLRHRRVVRKRRVRGDDQDRDAGDASQHPVRQRERGRHVRQVRQARRRRGLVRESVLGRSDSYRHSVSILCRAGPHPRPTRPHPRETAPPARLLLTRSGALTRSAGVGPQAQLRMLTERVKAGSLFLCELLLQPRCFCQRPPQRRVALGEPFPLHDFVKRLRQLVFPSLVPRRRGRTPRPAARRTNRLPRSSPPRETATAAARWPVRTFLAGHRAPPGCRAAPGPDGPRRAPPSSRGWRAALSGARSRSAMASISRRRSASGVSAARADTASRSCRASSGR